MRICWPVPGIGFGVFRDQGGKDVKLVMQKS